MGLVEKSLPVRLGKLGRGFRTDGLNTVASGKCAIDAISLSPLVLCAAEMIKLFDFHVCPP